LKYYDSHFQFVSTKNSAIDTRCANLHIALSYSKNSFYFNYIQNAFKLKQLKANPTVYIIDILFTLKYLEIKLCRLCL